jgi:hypothetical protein
MAPEEQLLRPPRTGRQVRSLDGLLEHCRRRGSEGTLQITRRSARLPYPSETAFRDLSGDSVEMPVCDPCKFPGLRF